MKEINKKLKEIEKEHLIPEAWDYWYIVRFIVYNQVYQKLNVYDKANRNSSKNSRTLLGHLKIFLNKNPLFKKPKDYLIFGIQRRKKKDDGLFWDIYTDFFVRDVLNGKSLTVESSYYGEHLKPVATRNLAYLDGLRYFQKFLVKKFFLQEIPTNVLDVFGNMEEALKAEWNISLSIRQIAQRSFTAYQRKQLIYRFVLKKLKPKAVLLVCSYGKEAIIRAAKDLDIPTIEIQHGVITPYHVGYDCPTENPKNDFPDYLFTFGDYWRTSANYPIPPERIYTIGYPFLEENIKKYAMSQKKKQVLFISQGTIGLHLSRLAVQYQTLHPEMRVIFKLHPGEVETWREDYPWLDEASRETSIEVVEEHHPDLYDLMAQSSVQVGVYSTALFEGYRLGCRTYIVNLPGVAYMEDFLKKGYGTIISEPEQIYSAVLPPKIRQRGEDFFAPNWRLNFQEALSEILGRCKL